MKENIYKWMKYKAILKHTLKTFERTSKRRRRMASCWKKQQLNEDKKESEKKTWEEENEVRATPHYRFKVSENNETS